MLPLGIEHQLRDSDARKAASDADPLDRRLAGVRRPRALRPAADPPCVLIGPASDTAREAAAPLPTLRRDIWASAPTEPALLSRPPARIVVAPESEED